jgi:hypothetical protein
LESVRHGNQNKVTVNLDNESKIVETKMIELNKTYDVAVKIYSLYHYNSIQSICKGLMRKESGLVEMRPILDV